MRVPKRLGAPIASRELVREGSDQPIQAFIWRPFKEGKLWRCPYQIKGFGDEEIRYACGDDSVQALSLSFQALRVDLSAKQNKIYWGGPDIADAGFPRCVDWSFGADIYEYLCDLMDQELLPFPGDYLRSKKQRNENIARWKRQKVSNTRTPRPRGRKGQ